MCQRAAIAIAMANQPALLLADEPTSALDVASGEEVMARLTGIRDRDNTTIFLVTHNMSVVSRYADSVGVMNQGFLVEWGAKEEILKDPRHPYTRMLLDSVPRLNGSLTGKAAVPDVYKRQSFSSAAMAPSALRSPAVTGRSSRV